MYNIVRIIQTVKQKGISLSFMSLHIGRYKNKLADCKNGKTKLTEKEVTMIANYLNVSEDYFYDRTDDPNIYKIKDGRNIIDCFINGNTDNLDNRKSDKSINQIIIELLGRGNFTQKELGEYLNVSMSSLSNWLRLGRNIPNEYILPISRFFKVSVYYLLGGTKKQLGQSGNILNTQMGIINRLFTNMTPKDRERMITILKTAFSEYFDGEEK